MRNPVFFGRLGFMFKKCHQNGFYLRVMQLPSLVIKTRQNRCLPPVVIYYSVSELIVCLVELLYGHTRIGSEVSEVTVVFIVIS